MSLDLALIFMFVHTVNVYLNLACMFFWRKMIFQHVGVDLIKPIYECTYYLYIYIYMIEI